MQSLTLKFARSANVNQWALQRVAVAAILIAGADLLFYKAGGVGLSLAIFIAALGAAAWTLTPARGAKRRRTIAFAVIAGGVIALIEDVNVLSVVFGVFGLVVGALMLATSAEIAWMRYAPAAALAPFVGPFRLIKDFLRVRRADARRSKARRPFDWAGWVAPLVVGGAFVALFASANPLVENWLSAIDLRAFLALVPPQRIVFWGLILCLIWPVLHVRAVPAAKGAKIASATAPDDWGGLMSAAAVQRSLVLFNVLFALQTIMDIGYLWGGWALPPGMSHASYVHRGAYPLVVTALLAAGFVLVALRRNAPAQARWMRPLILAFVGQNILLVLSSILRLDLYVAAYSLTYWRVAAFIWMALVAFGLVSILARIIHERPNGWLLGVNAAALAATLYVCCFVDFANLIARYNLAHCKEISGAGASLDHAYLESLGPQILPAIDDFSGGLQETDSFRLSLDKTRRGLVAMQKQTVGDWRAWSFAKWRLARYLAKIEIRPAG